MAKVFPFRDLRKEKQQDASINLHAAHNDAFTHLYALARARGVSPEAIRRELMSRCAPVQRRGNADPSQDGHICFTPALRGVDVSPDPHPDISPQAEELLGKLLECAELKPEDCPEVRMPLNSDGQSHTSIRVLCSDVHDRKCHAFSAVMYVFPNSDVNIFRQ